MLHYYQGWITIREPISSFSVVGEKLLPWKFSHPGNFDLIPLGGYIKKLSDVVGELRDISMTSVNSKASNLSEIFPVSTECFIFSRTSEFHTLNKQWSYWIEQRSIVKPDQYDIPSCCDVVRWLFQFFVRRNPILLTDLIFIVLDLSCNSGTLKKRINQSPSNVGEEVSNLNELWKVKQKVTSFNCIF